MPQLTALPARSLGALRTRGDLALLGLVVRRVHRWSAESQQGSRRNAMTASTALAARRAERDDVEAYLSAATRTHEPASAVQHA